MLRPATASALLLLACTGKDALPPDRPQTPDSPAADTDEPTPAATPDDPPDSPTPPDETPPPPPPPPTSLGGGFVDLLDPLWAAGGWELVVTVEPNGHAFEEITVAVVGDLFGDGVLDLVVSGIRPPGSPSNAPMIQVFSFDAATGLATFDPARTAQISPDQSGRVHGLIDIDDDGDLDLLRGFHSRMIGLIDGEMLTWLPAPAPAGRTQAPPFAVAALGDVDLDGWLDLILETDDCRTPAPNNVSILPILRTGLQTWEAAPHLLPQPELNVCAAGIIPFGPDLLPTMLVASGGCVDRTTSTGVYQLGSRNTDGHPVWSHIDPFPPDALFRYDPTSAGGPITWRAPMGMAVTDLDLDGLLDMVWSLSDPLLHLFGGTGTDLVEDRTFEAGPHMPIGGHGVEQLPWGVVPLDVDADGRPDLVVALGDDYASRFALPWNGPYPVVSYWNDGQGGFADVSSLTGLDALGSWAALGLADIDGDAAPDLLAGGAGPFPRIYRNDVGGHHVAVRLKGTTSNHLGMGAIVTAEVAGLPTQTAVTGQSMSPSIVDDGSLFFGLGPHDTLQRLTVRWPSGVVQEVHDLQAGAWHEVVEPALITLSEPDRHLPADGQSTVEVVVTPRDALGQPRAAQVTIEAPWGPAAFAGPATQDGLGWRRTLMAPMAAGSSVIEVTLDGVIVPVHPRVWWDGEAP
jgi:hypothetical protein